jgi:hypothetical protein
VNEVSCQANRRKEEKESKIPTSQVQSSVMKASNLLSVEVDEIVKTRCADFGQFLLNQYDILWSEAGIFGTIYILIQKGELAEHTYEELVDFRCQEVSCECKRMEKAEMLHERRPEEEDSSVESM